MEKKSDIIDTFKINAITSENVASALKKIPLENKKVLTIDSSGDDLLNSAFYGACDLTLCNINPYSKDYLYLKIAALISLDYKEYCWFFFKNSIRMNNNNKMFSKKLFKKVGPVLRYLNYDAFLYFDDLFKLFGPKETRENCFIDNNYHTKALRNFNIYTRNEYAYNKLRDTILKTNINFIDENITEASLDKEYDVMLLSTLFSEMNVKKFANLIKKLDNNLSTDGLMMLAYLWNNNTYTNNYSDEWMSVYLNPESNKMLSKYISDVYTVCGYMSYLYEVNKFEDKVLIYKKNK